MQSGWANRLSKLTQNNVSAAVLKHLFPGFRVPILKLGPVLTEKKPGDIFSRHERAVYLYWWRANNALLKERQASKWFQVMHGRRHHDGAVTGLWLASLHTQSEARAKFPKAHLYWHGREQCWNDKAAFSSRALAAVPAASSRPVQASVPVLAPEFGGPLETIRRALLGDTAQAAVPAASSRPTQAAVPVASPRPVPAAVPMSSVRPVPTTDGLGSQCQLLPCEYVTPSPPRQVATEPPSAMGRPFRHVTRSESN